MSEFTKYPLPEQLFGQVPGPAEAGTAPTDDIAFYVQRGKQLHAKAVREALIAGFCSVGKAADRAMAAIGSSRGKAGHSAS